MDKRVLFLNGLNRGLAAVGNQVCGPAWSSVIKKPALAAGFSITHCIQLSYIVISLKEMIL